MPIEASRRGAAPADCRTFKNPDTFPRDGRLDPAALKEMVSIMVEGEELAAMPQGDLGRYLDDSPLDPR
jgi:hypothetical protein